MFLVIFLNLLILYLVIRIFIQRKSDSLKCLVGKTAVVTGGNSGLGYATSLLLASRGCRVIIADCDDSKESINKIVKLTGNTEIIYKYLDLSSLKNVREFAEELNKTEEKIDILVNNAGIGATRKKITNDGLNTLMQINYFGAFLLTHLLLDLLKSSRSARVVFLGSVTMYKHNLSLENLNSNLEEDYGLQEYRNSKLCCVLAAQEFGKRLEKYNIMVNSADPGAVRTKIFQKIKDVSYDLSFDATSRSIMSIWGQDSLSGAQTIFHLATSEKLDKETGRHYCYLKRWLKPSVLNDQEFCEKIWKKTEELVGLKTEEMLQV